MKVLLFSCCCPYTELDLCTVLLIHCLHNRCNYSEIELLFQLLRAFTGRFLCNMTFLKEYMEEEIPRKYSIAQKRALFFRFVEFNDPHFNDELKAKVHTQAIRAGKSIYYCMPRGIKIPRDVFSKFCIPICGFAFQVMPKTTHNSNYS